MFPYAENLQRRYRLIAWLRYPLPGMPVRREVMGTNLNNIASGLFGTVCNQLEWPVTPTSPPLFEQITVRPCLYQNIKLNFTNINRMLKTSSMSLTSLLELSERLGSCKVGCKILMKTSGTYIKNHLNQLCLCIKKKIYSVNISN